MNRGYVCPTIRPNKTLKNQLERAFGATRWMYNQLLERSKRDYELWKAGETDKKPSVTHFSLVKQTPQIRKETEWWTRKYPGGTVSHNCTAEHLANAYKNFFEGRTEYPKFKSKHGEKAFQFCCDHRKNWLRRDNKHVQVRIPNIGWVNVGDVPHWIESKHIKRMTVKKKGTRYSVSILCEFERAEEIDNLRPASKRRVIGIDTGCAVRFATSDGELFNQPDVSRLRDQLKETQKKLAEAKKAGKSDSYIQKLRNRIGNLHGKIGRVQKDYLHKITTALTDNQGIVVENLDVDNMIGKGRNLNRIIHEAGMSNALTILEYKAEARGCTLVKVCPRYTSQICSSCGHTSKKNRKSQESFVCSSCGHRENADVNAAKNILTKGLTNEELHPLLVGANHKPSVEQTKQSDDGPSWAITETGMNGEAVNRKVGAS